VAIWNATRRADESMPGQLIHMSTSVDGKRWTPPRSLLQVSFAARIRSPATMCSGSPCSS
jgi:hypothetical protein